MRSIILAHSRTKRSQIIENTSIFEVIWQYFKWLDEK